MTAVMVAHRSAGESLISEGQSGSKGGWATGETGKLGIIQQPVPKDC